MNTYDAVVEPHRATRREHCVAHESDLEQIGRAAGQQVRIWRSSDTVALYTVGGPSLATPGSIGMGRAGRERLAGGPRFAVTVDAQVVDAHRTDEDAAGVGEFVERLIPGRDRQLAVIAPHGGDIEEHTDEQAQRVAMRLSAAAPWVWVCKGWGRRQNAFERWHITSSDISPESFPLLKRMMALPFAHAVSFHGFDRSRVPGADVRIGGRADDDLKGLVRGVIEDQFRRRGKPWNVVVDREGDPFDALDPRNIVNRLAADQGGLQIEQSKRARDSLALEIADAVASVYARLLATAAH